MSDQGRSASIITPLYELLTGDEHARACKEIPDEACREQPANFFLHLLSSLATKTGDELASARLVLAWLLATLGAPAFMTGLLVPIREAGALLPQLAVAGYLRRMPVRKWLWVGGSLVQGAAVVGMAIAAFSLPFYVALAADRAGTSASGLGLLLIASGVAGSVSAPVWGRLADRSSRRVMIAGAVIAGVLGVLVFALDAAFRSLLEHAWLFAVLFFVLAAAHGGVRLGRKTYLVDLAKTQRTQSKIFRRHQGAPN